VDKSSQPGTGGGKPPRKGAGRSVYRSKEFDECAAALEPNVERLDDITRAAEWIISLRPTQPPCFPIPDTDLWIVITHPPPLRIFFTIDSDTACTMQWIEPWEGPDDG
jgi:hypothetical protein